jgi:predicted ATPase/transcriptional regulator with XRE-family HTH domain
VSETFGERLRRYRLTAGLSQEDLAERAGLSAHGISDLERGARNRPYRDTIQRLAAALRLDEDATADLQAGRSRPQAPVHAVPPLRSDIPEPLTSFVGRDHDVRQVLDLLLTGRLVTLTGVGGCGKTRLGLEVARRLSHRLADGVVLVELASVVDEALVPQAVASTLGIREVPTQPLLSTLSVSLKSRQTLLVLDNCEHLLDACARVADALLRACPRLSILATSREALGLTGEVSWRVPSLPLPPVNPLPGPEEMAEFSAVRLFVERAQAAHPPFALTRRNAPATAQICHQLDGIPLALELAAVRVRGMSLDELAARLDQRFRLLTGGSRAALPRQQTLRATIDWSYQLLTAEERLLFGRLSVFASSWTLDAAEAVCGGRGIHSDDVVALVLRLIDKSLVVPEDETDHGQRYGLLQTLRQYGREQLVAADEADALNDLHARHFLMLAEQTESARSGLDTSGWTDRLALYRADFEAALDWLIARSDGERALRLAAVLWHMWQVRGYLTQGRRRIAALLEIPGSEAPTLARARVLNGAGVLALNQRDVQSARRQFGESLRLHRHLRHDQGVAWVLIHLSWLCLDVGRLKAGDRFVHEAHAICTRLGDRNGIARCLNLLGYLAWLRGSLDASCNFQRRSLALNRDIDDRWGIAWALHRLSISLMHLAEFDHVQLDISAVQRLIHEEVEIWREIGDRRHFAFGVCDVAGLATLEHDFERAQFHLAEGLGIFAELEDGVGVAWVLTAYGFLLTTQGRHEAALGAYAAVFGYFAQGNSRLVGAPAPFEWRFELERQRARDVLGAHAAARAWADGQKISLPDAIAHAQRASAAGPAESVVGD